MFESNSIRITAPLRYFRRQAGQFLKYTRNFTIGFLRAIFTRLPLPRNTKSELKSFAFQRLEFLFKETQAYQNWRNLKQAQTQVDLRNSQETFALGKDLNEKFSFQKVLTPEVSIIIPVYGKIDYTFTCLKSISQMSSKYRFEVIVVDDCSPDNTCKVLSRVRGLRLVRNEENLGFIRS